MDNEQQTINEPGTGVINTEEELLQALQNSSDINELTGEEDTDGELPQENHDGDIADADGKPAPGDNSNPAPNGKDGEKAGEKDGDGTDLGEISFKGPDEGQVAFDSEKHKTVVHYLNDRFGLELNMEQLPKEITLEEQAETVADLLDRASKGFAARMGQYQQLEELLKDNETAVFLKAKQEGKSLREFATEYASSPDGLADELLVAQKLKEVMTDATEQDIQDIIDGYKEKDKLTNIAEGYRKKDAEAKAQQEELSIKQQELLAKQEQERLEQEKTKFDSYLKGITKIHGVPFTEDMRTEVYSAVTKPVDKDGNTLIDIALQSDQGLALMALGLTQMQKLIAAKGSISKNKAQKSLMDRLSADPQSLQSNGEGARQVSGDNNEEAEIAANMF